MSCQRRELTPLVSVIVPVYRVEPYLRKCLDSILAQSYKNLEIILVDDGSPDNCGAICDEYAAMDQRIRVIHQANGGLAAARNTGLRTAAGDWIAWVDSDDWVEPDFIRYMLSGALENGADIVISGRYEEHPDRLVFHSPGQRLLNSEEALVELIQDQVIFNYMWDKLWRAELFRGLTFPVGRSFEDVALCWQLFDRAKRILCLPEGFYHYLIRGDGIVGKNLPSYPLLVYSIRRARCESLSIQYPRMRQLLVYDCLSIAVTAWSRYYSNERSWRKQHRAQYSEISEFARRRPPDKAFVQSCGKAERLVLRLVPYDAGWSLLLAGMLNSLYRLKNGCDIRKWSYKPRSIE